MVKLVLLNVSSVDQLCDALGWQPLWNFSSCPHKVHRQLRCPQHCLGCVPLSYILSYQSLIQEMMTSDTA